jgi:cytoskeletal protein CcmA (bactofilin family)
MAVNYFSQPKIPREAIKQTVSEPNIVEPAPAKASPDILSTFGTGMMITGNIVCPGALQIYGRVTGEIQASHITVYDGAKVEGKIIAQEAVIEGTFNGTIHGNSVKLQGGAKVDGEIFNKSLSIDSNVQFEGVSRRLERPVDVPKSGQASAAQPAAASTTPIDPIAKLLV